MPSKSDNSNSDSERAESKPPAQRLTVKHLMFWLFGVAVALTAAQQLKRSHYDAHVAVAEANGWTPREFESLGLANAVVAVGFGTGISLAIFAVWGGPGFWRDPARIGITVLGAIGIMAFLGELLTATYVARTGSPLIWQTDYFGFCEFVVHLFGFLLVCVLTPWLEVKWNWKFAWWSLVLFALFGLIIHSFNFPMVYRSVPWLSGILTSHWYAAKLVQTGISVTGLAVAISVDLWTRNSVSWLAVVTAIGMIIGQIAMHVRDISALF